MATSRADLIALAHEHGFAEVRFAPAGPAPHAEVFTSWVESGAHGSLGWLETGHTLRCDPRERLPSARTVMVMSVPHHHRVPPDPGGRTGRVARYAWGRDYHNLVGKRLRKLKRSLHERGIDGWGGVDTAPLLERSWATAAGMGFNGKNGVQILPARSSWMFLAVLVLDVDVPPDPPLRDHCGSCRRCLDACPTDAFTAPHLLDARRCISYWTIEARGLAPRALRPGFGRWLFGCDVCQEVCPHNVAAPDPDEDDLRPRHAWVDLDALVLASDETLMDRYLGTPLRRPKAHGLKRNALVVLGNLGDRDAAPTALAALTHPEPVVRAAAVWCLARLDHALPPGLSDPDETVRDEIDAARQGLVTPATPLLR